MPSYRRYARSGFRKGKRLYRYARKNPQQAMALAQSAWRGVKLLRGIVNSEMFHTDANFTDNSATNYIHNLTAISQGDTESQRTGNSLLLKSLSINGYMQINPSTAAATRVTICLVRDKQQIQDTTPGLGDIFTSASDTQTLLNRTTVGRFQIMWRKQYILTAVTGGGDVARIFKKYTKLNFHTRFNGSASTDIQKNGLYLCILTSEVTNYPTIVLNTRINYHDN